MFQDAFYENHHTSITFYFVRKNLAKITEKENQSLNKKKTLLITTLSDHFHTLTTYRTEHQNYWSHFLGRYQNPDSKFEKWNRKNTFVSVIDNVCIEIHLSSDITKTTGQIH